MDLADLTKISFPKNKQFLLIAGPCLIEGEGMAMKIAERVKSISDKLSIPYVFKGSFKKVEICPKDFTEKRIRIENCYC